LDVTYSVVDIVLSPACFASFRTILIPCSGVFLEKLTGPQLVKFPAFYGTQRHITILARAHHLSLARARSIQSMPTHTTWRCILILFWERHIRERIIAQLC